MLEIRSAAEGSLSLDGLWVPSKTGETTVSSDTLVAGPVLREVGELEGFRVVISSFLDCRNSSHGFLQSSLSFRIE